MTILPEAKIRCPDCYSTIAEINPAWIANAFRECFNPEGKEIKNPWAVIRKKVLDQWREFGPLKGWMTQGECNERDCTGKWWDGTKLNVAVPSHLKRAKEHDP